MIRSKRSQFWRRQVVSVLACLFFIALFFIQVQPARGQADETSRSWNQPVKPFRIIGNIYYVGASDVTSYLIATPKGHILLDSGFAETVPQIKRNIAALGFRLEDVKILINSHAHYDHAGGLAELKELTRATLLASEADASLLANGGKDDPNFGDRYAYAPVKVDQTLRDGEVVKLGDTILTAHLTPGHTKGCTTWTTKVSDNGKTYKVVFVGSTSAPGYRLIDNVKHPNIVADYTQTFRRMKKLSPDVFLASHGMFFGLQKKMELFARQPKQNPFVDPKGYKDFVKQTEKQFRAQLSDQQKTNQQ
ncbi:MAG TPA: subclass B3 metallo-beta-lactamase [Pyrinomonadaceae bacterium]|nr:subclass B3 metallo-beta-lactamase [Pyrinomonadaceae bacterium]